MEFQRDWSDPLDLSHHFSFTTKARAISKVKNFYKYFAIPGIGQLAGGLPNDLYFPYDTLEAKIALPARWQPSTEDKQEQTNIKKQKQLASHLVVPHHANTVDRNREIDLVTALQYGQAAGYPPLLQFIKQFTIENLHPTVPYKGGPDVILTCGATDGFSKAIQCFNNEWAEGRDSIAAKEGLLVEEFAYMGAIQTAAPRGMNIVPVAIDAEGMLAEGAGGLRDVLASWDYNRGKRPHLIYTVSIGQNPTSGTLSTPRRQAIYRICQHYDIIIIEDEPYWYLQYPSASPPVPAPPKSSGSSFLDALQPSYLSIDTDGRVLRLDTFSKTVAPGCRLGWITASPAVVERIMRITETSTQQPSGFVQSMIAELLMGPQHDGSKSVRASDSRQQSRGWDVTGWVRWLEGLRGEYERRMNMLADILDAGAGAARIAPQKLLGPDRNSSSDDTWSFVEVDKLFSFVRPSAGMFLWLEVHFSSHPLATTIPPQKLSQALWVFWTREPCKVLVAPGTLFATSPQISEGKAWRFFRLCFAAAPLGELPEIGKRTVQGIVRFWEIMDVEVIQELLDDMDAAGESQEVYQAFGHC